MPRAVVTAIALVCACSESRGWCPTSDELFVPNLDQGDTFDVDAEGEALAEQPCAYERRFEDPAPSFWGDWVIVHCEEWCDTAYRGHYCVLDEDLWAWEGTLSDTYNAELMCEATGDLTICSFPCSKWGSG